MLKANQPALSRRVEHVERARRCQRRIGIGRMWSPLRRAAICDWASWPVCPWQPVWAAFRYRPRIGDVVVFRETGAGDVLQVGGWAHGRTVGPQADLAVRI